MESGVFDWNDIAAACGYKHAVFYPLMDRSTSVEILPTVLSDTLINNLNLCVGKANTFNGLPLTVDVGHKHYGGALVTQDKESPTNT